MSFFQKCTLSFTPSSSGVATAQYSSVYNGYFHSVNIITSKACSTRTTVTITAETTTRSIIKVYHPTTGGTWYFPQMKRNTSTGGSSGLGASIPLAFERVRVLVGCSSGTKSRTATVTMYFGG